MVSTSFLLQIFKNVEEVEQTNFTRQIHRIDNDIDKYTECIEEMKIKTWIDMNLENEELELREEKLGEEKREETLFLKSFSYILNEQFEKNMETREKGKFFSNFSNLLNNLKNSGRFCQIFFKLL